MQRIYLVLLLFFVSHFSFAQSTYLWKVSSKDNDKVSYLFGTYHRIGESFFKKYPVLEKSLLSCDQVVTEVQLKKDSLLSVYDNRTATDDLQRTLNEENYQLVQKILKGSFIDIGKFYPEEVIASLQGQFELLNCPALSASDKYFLDRYIQVLAEENQKTNVYLETVDLQLQYLDKTTVKMSWPVAKKYIDLTLKQYLKYQQSGKNTCPALVDFYLNFRNKYQFSKSCNRLDAKKKQLVVERNEKWMQVLPGLIQKNNVFVAVGLEHLNYKCGLIVQLQELGYIVEPVEMIAN